MASQKQSKGRQWTIFDCLDVGSMVKNGPALLQLREAIENAEGWAGSRDIRPMLAL